MSFLATFLILCLINQEIGNSKTFLLCKVPICLSIYKYVSDIPSRCAALREQEKGPEGGGQKPVSGCSESREKGRHIHSQLERDAECCVRTRFEVSRTSPRAPEGSREGRREVGREGRRERKREGGGKAL